VLERPYVRARREIEATEDEGGPVSVAILARDGIVPSMVRRVVALAPLLLFLAACGGSTSSEHGEDASADMPPAADAGHDARPADAAKDAVHDAPAASDVAETGADAPRDSGPLALDDACYGMSGLTGRSVLDAMKSVYHATYTPIGSGAPTPLTITTKYAGGAVTCLPYEGESGRPASVAVVVEIGFSTANGLFDETFATPVTRGAGSTTLAWDAVVAASALEGTYKPTLSGKVNLSFGGSFAEATTSGLVEQQASHGGGGEVAGAGTWK
jgi:hypothetical protein